MWRRTRTTRDEGMSTVDRELVLETAKIMLSRTSPEELAILDDEAARYFAGPPNVPAAVGGTSRSGSDSTSPLSPPTRWPSARRW